ncbi:hypothetical protein HAX54_014477 [Datura stramonium]|uniref:Uncharacterized protein n=1 Tax=Datura stramonium TaxID=4076 RepID=A0ABS8RIR4_DATST|nr:hypothetical protein [Datura stramonium]
MLLPPFGILNVLHLLSSQPLIESDKTLAESIGRVKVLYITEVDAHGKVLCLIVPHCSGCSFGNSPVICNRCGVQIVHRQVHEHALSCPVTTTAAGVDSNQTTAHSGTPASQTPNPQTTTSSLLPGQDPNQQANASSGLLQLQLCSTSEQWYQQQYQQYYQQYAGYDP